MLMLDLGSILIFRVAICFLTAISCLIFATLHWNFGVTPYSPSYYAIKSNQKKLCFRSRPRRPSAASSLFQKRGVQVLIIGLIGVMAVSMAAMAAIYIMGQVNEDGSTGRLPIAICSVLGF